jgi:hypothetical protein
VLVSSSLSINRSNRLTRFGYRFRVLALCVYRSTFASTKALIKTDRRNSGVVLHPALVHYDMSPGWAYVLSTNQVACSKFKTLN